MRISTIGHQTPDQTGPNQIAPSSMLESAKPDTNGGSISWIKSAQRFTWTRGGQKCFNAQQGSKCAGEPTNWFKNIKVLLCVCVSLLLLLLLQLRSDCLIVQCQTVTECQCQFKKYGVCRVQVQCSSVQPVNGSVSQPVSRSYNNLAGDSWLMTDDLKFEYIIWIMFFQFRMTRPPAKRSTKGRSGGSSGSPPTQFSTPPKCGSRKRLDMQWWFADGPEDRHSASARCAVAETSAGLSLARPPQLVQLYRREGVNCEMPVPGPAT